MEMYERTSEDVRSLIGHAKLDENKLTPITQVLHFSFSDEKYFCYKLLQLDSHLAQVLQEGSEIYFKGGKTEEVVLCSNSQTYELREAETSNSLIVVPGLLWPKESNLNQSLDKSLEEDNLNISNSFITNTDQLDTASNRTVKKQSVHKILHTYYKVHRIKPKFRKLFDLLQITKYNGPENEYNINKKFLFTYGHLLSTVQASSKELQDGFHEIHALEINNHFRILEIEYEFRVVSYMMAVIEENSWNFLSVSRKETIDSLKNFVPQAVIEGLFDIYTIWKGDDQFSYKPHLIGRLYAQTILKNSSKFNLDDFLMTWQASMPEGMKTDISHLKGIALVDREANPACIKALDNYALPITLLERFQAMFKIKKLWTLEQMEPYIECFTTPSLSLTTLISKYSRASTVNGIRMYGAKHSS